MATPRESSRGADAYPRAGLGTWKMSWDRDGRAAGGGTGDSRSAAGASATSNVTTNSNGRPQWQRAQVGGQAPSAGCEPDSAEQGSPHTSSSTPPVLAINNATSRARPS